MFAQENFELETQRGCSRGRHFAGRDESCGPRGSFEGRFGWIRGGRFEMPGGFGPWGRGGFGRGFGHGRERLFDAGDIKLVILKLLSEQPSYGYQLMKTMEERLGGGYTPSAGVVYPTLTMLEEEGLATSTATDGKKIYSVTPDGLEYLKANAARVDQLFERLDEAGQGFRRGRSPELMKAFMDLRGAVVSKVSRGKATAEQIKKIAEAIHAAAEAIDKL
jgi:DNA-binding PadR family transcriptional regulator